MPTFVSGQHAGDIFFLESGLKRGEVVELDNSCGNGGVDRRPDISAARLRDSVLQRDEAFVHRAVIAPVEDEDLRPLRDVAGEADGKPVRIGGSERELPVREAEAVLKFLAYDDRVFAGQHQRDSAPRLLLHCRYRGGWRVAGHRAGIAEAEIDVTVAVDVEELGAPRFTHERRECAGPLRHPVHGHAAE
jgi:hypothetical protein